uniref:Uncharacterized protein n=1 Tax=Pavo cristatus TaxID=9049 RepID=A0A8C9EY45_PAVCR
MDLGLLQRVKSVCALVVILQPNGLVGWACDQAVQLLSILLAAAVMKVLGICINSFLHLTDLTDLSKILLKIHRAHSHRNCGFYFWMQKRVAIGGIYPCSLSWWRTGHPPEDTALTSASIQLLSAETRRALPCSREI